MIEPKLRFKADDGSQFPDWEEHNFGDLYKVCSGYAFKYENYCASGVALVNGQAIQHGWIDDNNMNYLPETFLQQYKDFVLKENDIVLGLNRPITNGKLKIARVPKEYNNSLLYQRAGKIVCKKAVDDDFSYALLAREIFKFTIKEAAGSDQPFISTSKLNNWKIIVPSSEQEQQKIAEFLSTIDTVIAKQKETVSAWEERKKGVMQKLFSQEVRFKADDGSEFPEWEEKKLGDVCEYRKGQSVGVNYVGTENMNQNFSGVDSLDSTNEVKGVTYCVGDTLMSNIRPYLKKTWKADRNGVCSTDVLVFRPVNVDSDFLYYNISSEKFVLYVMTGVKGSKMPRGDKGHIMEYDMLTPCLAEQQKIADCLSSLDEVIEKQKATLSAWEELKKGLLQQMFV